MGLRTLKSAGYATAATLVICNLQSCSKYEDGPAISLKTKKARLVGKWDVVQIGTQVYTSSGAYIVEMHFDKDGDARMVVGQNYTSYYGYTYFYGDTFVGSWEFGEHKRTLDLILDGSAVNFDIRRLTKDEVWLEDLSDHKEWKLEAQ
jgi:hypothetical protein